MNPGRLMPRARAYLAVLSARHLGVGIYALARPETFTGTSFDSVRAVVPLRLWGVAFVVVGFHAALICAIGREMHARAVITASSALTGAWTAGFVLAAFQGQLDAPSVPIVWWALTAKDLVVAGMQLRLPIVEMPDDPEPRL